MLCHITPKLYENDEQVFRAGSVRPDILSAMANDLNGTFRMRDDRRRYAAEKKPIQNSQFACADENSFGASIFRFGEDRGSRIAFDHFGIHD